MKNNDQLPEQETRPAAPELLSPVPYAAQRLSRNDLLFNGLLALAALALGLTMLLLWVLKLKEPLGTVLWPPAALALIIWALVELWQGWHHWRSAEPRAIGIAVAANENRPTISKITFSIYQQ